MGKKVSSHWEAQGTPVSLPIEGGIEQDFQSPLGATPLHNAESLVQRELPIALLKGRDGTFRGRH